MVKSCGSCMSPAPLGWMGLRAAMKPTLGFNVTNRGGDIPPGPFPHPTLCPPPRCDLLGHSECHRTVQALHAVRGAAQHVCTLRGV